MISEKLIIKEVMRKELTRVFQKETSELNSLKSQFGNPEDYPNNKQLSELTIEQIKNLQSELMNSLGRLGNIENELRSKICRLDILIMRKSKQMKT